MYSIDVMVEQHRNISRMLRIIKAACCSILEGADVDQAEFADIVDFVRNYADAHHHQREEQVLFPEMIDKLGPLANTIITHGMLVEHDLGRAHIRSLNEALKLYAEDFSQLMLIRLHKKRPVLQHFQKKIICCVHHSQNSSPLHPA